MLINLVRNLISAEDKRLVFIMILAYIPALLVAIVMHEFAHGIVAYWNGDDTAKLAGRLNVNPVKHFDPIGFLMLAVIGFGWAKPVPIDPRRFRNYKKGMITVSLAGVVCNFLIAFVATGLFALYLFATKSAVMNMQAGTAAYYAFSFFEYLLVYIVLINLTLMAFNLIPVYPLDGFRVVDVFSKKRSGLYYFLRNYGIYVLYFLVLLSILADFTGFWQLDILGIALNYAVGIIKIPITAFWGLFF